MTTPTMRYTLEDLQRRPFDELGLEPAGVYDDAIWSSSLCTISVRTPNILGPTPHVANANRSPFEAH